MEFVDTFYPGTLTSLLQTLFLHLFIFKSYLSCSESTRENHASWKRQPHDIHRIIIYEFQNEFKVRVYY